MEPKKIRKIIFSSVGIGLITAFTITLNVLATTKFDNIFEKYFGKSPTSLIGETHGADTMYYKSDFSSPKELYVYEEKKVAEIVTEGVTLLENNNLLPLNKNTTLVYFPIHR